MQQENEVEPSATDIRAIRRALLRWFDRERRSMPWRARRGAYRTVVSEFMLQQTQVATVIPHFNRFVRLFPNFRALASATEEEVLAAWSGLGYYRRARNLKRAAVEIVNEHGGRLPHDPVALLQLPGFGAYTVAAVGSIALGMRLAAIDGNVRRVLARLCALEISGTTDVVLNKAAARLLAPGRPGDWNEAMMELGAMVCSARAPGCARCPLMRRCQAFALGKPEAFPAPKAQPRTVRVREVAVAAMRGGKVLVMRRGDEESFANMWEFPRLERKEIDGGIVSAEHVLAELAGLKVLSSESIGREHSAFTHHRVESEIFCARAAPGRVKRHAHAEHRWIDPALLKDLAAGSTQRRLFSLLVSHLS